MEHFTLLPATLIISILKKMGPVAFCRVYRTCRFIKGIADTARRQITIGLTDNQGKGFGLDFAFYTYGDPLTVRIYKSELDVHESLASLKALQQTSPQNIEDLYKILKPLSFFKWTIINICPGGYFAYTDEEAWTNQPVLAYIDCTYRALQDNHLTCEKLKALPTGHINSALKYLQIKNWQTRQPTHYERGKMDNWIAKVVDCGVIDKDICLSVHLFCEFLDDVPKLLNLFKYLDVSIEDYVFRGLSSLSTCLGIFNHHFNHLRMFPRPQEVRFSLWKQFEYPIVDLKNNLNFSFLEYTEFAEEREIHRRGLQASPKVLHVPIVDREQHLMVVIFQGRNRNRKRYCRCYVKIYFAVVSDWEKWLKGIKRLFHTMDELISEEKNIDQFKRDFFEL